MSSMAKVFELDRKALNVPRAVAVVLVLLAVVIVLEVLNQPHYVITVVFAVLFVGLSDPGGDFGDRAARMGGVALIGALLTLVGFATGPEAWGIVVLAAFVVTLGSGLAITFGVRRFVAGLLLNVWFLCAIALPVAYERDGVATDAWSQALAWLAGSALWIAFASVVWLARRRTSRPPPLSEIPADDSTRKLTRPIILFALIRAIAVAIAVAIPFGLDLPEADWMPLATLVALKPDLGQSTLVAEQRLAGAILGALVAAVLLLAVDDKQVLEVAVVLVLTTGAAIHGVNYALYNAAIAAGVLIAIDLPHPSDLADEGLRVLYTFLGVGLAVLVMLLATQLGKRAAAKPAPHAA
jgi:hypothetical protein